MKNTLIHICFLFVWLNVKAQKPMVLLDVDPKEAELGEILTITVKTNVQGELDIDFPSGFVHGYNVMNGMEEEMDYNTGKVITYYYISQTGAMNKEGSFAFGPAYIKKGNKVYRSNTVSVTIKKTVNTSSNGENFTAKQLRQPAFGVVERSNTSIYEGEPVVMNARIYSQFSPSHLENYNPYSVSGVIDKHDLGNTQRIYVEETKIKNSRWFTFVYDKNVIFPTGTGRIEIDPFKLLLLKNYESIPISSSSSFIDVKPLPKAPIDFAGGVGQFRVTRDISQTNLKQGDIFTLVFEVSGTGNLHNLLEPKLQLPKGFIVYGDPIVKEEFTFGSKGAEGKVTYEFNIQATLFGNLTIPGTRFSYFDPQKEKYVQLVTAGNELKIARDLHFKSNGTENNPEGKPEAQSEIGPMRANEGDNSPILIYGTPLFWIGIGSPLALALLFGFMSRRKQEQKPEEEIQERFKNVNRIINDYLHQAQAAFDQGNDSEYYSYIEKAINRTMTMCLHNDDTRVMSKTEILEALRNKNCDETTITRLKLILDRCEHARFGMGSAGGERINLINSVNEILSPFLHK